MRTLFFGLMILSVVLAACNADGAVSEKTKAEKVAEEKSKRTPVQKGRYQCWRLSSAGDEVASPLYILSDELYQVDEATGKYRFNPQENTIQFIDGPFRQDADPWIGFYTPQGTTTSGGGKTLETMIEVRKKSDVDEGNKRVILQCNCGEFKY